MGDNSILGYMGCCCALPSLTGGTKCCENCTNNPNRLKKENWATFTHNDLKIEPYINYSESMMYVSPKNIFDLMELLGDMYNITIYRIKELEGQKYFVVGLKMKEHGDELKDAVVNINFLKNE